MNKPRKPSGRPRRSRSKVQSTNSGKTIAVHQSISDRWKARRFARSARKAEYLSTLPKDPWKRLLYRLHPRRVAKYWFSREGGIMALKIIGVGIVAMFLLIVGLFAYYRKDLPNVKDISGSKVGGSVTYYDRTGKTVLWQDYNATKRIGVQGDQISNYMKQATVAIEDKDFYKHGAFDVRGILRAGIHDIFGGGGTQGGSTITQQLVKNDNNWTYDHSINRKLKEVILAVELERQYSKDDILTGYLNVAPYGNVDRGVEAASRDYFGISAKDLNLAQSAMLASIPKAPTAYSPYSDPKYNPSATANYFDQADLLARQHYVLDQMAKQHMITQVQADAAKKVDILAEIHPLESKYQGIKAPYFVLAAKQDLENKLGAAAVDLGGLKVITTVDLNLQSKAEELVQNDVAVLNRYTRGLADDAATIAEDVPTGQIMALVGGVDFNNQEYGKINFATSLVSPGSSFKPYDYVSMINNNNNVGAGSVLYDSRGPLPGYPCTDKSLPPPKGTGNCLEDYDFNYPGAITLRYALGGSRNVPAEKAMMSAVPGDTSPGYVKSINKTINTASSMMDNPYLQRKNQKTYNCYRPGVDVNSATAADLTQCYNSAGIGDGAYLSLENHVNGLSTLGRLGQAIPRTYILSVTNDANKQIYKWTQPKATQVVKADSAYIVDDMLSDPNASYLPGSCSATNCTQLNVSSSGYVSGGYKFQHDNGWKFAVKTGTTNFGFDGLMASWSSKYAVVSWVGNHTRNVDISKYGAAMETLTEPLTRGLMEAAHKDLKPVAWKQPAGIKLEPAFVVTHKVSRLGETVPSPSKDLFPSWYVGGSKSDSSVTIDKVSGKVATSCTPALAKEIQYNGNAASWNADIFAGGHASITTAKSKTGTSTVAAATDDVHNCNDPPPLVSVGLADGTTTCTNSCAISVTATQQSGGHPLSGGSYTASPAGTIAVQINGQTICTIAIPGSASDIYSDHSCSYSPTSSGSVSLSATVVDSVLYSGSAGPVTIQTSGGNENLTLSAVAGNPTTFSWTGGTGAVSVYKVSGTGVDSFICDGTPDGQCQAAKNGPNSAPGGTKVYAKDSSGNVSATITVQ